MTMRSKTKSTPDSSSITNETFDTDESSDEDSFVVASSEASGILSYMPRVALTEANYKALRKEVDRIDREREEAKRREEESRRTLLDERKLLQARLDEIDRMLAVLDGEHGDDGARRVLRNRLTDSAPKRVREILQQHPNGLTVHEIEERLGENKPTNSWSLHSALHRMVKAGEATFTGKRGERVYRLVLQKT